MTREERRAMWQARIDRWQHSGVRLTVFARQHQLDIKRLRYWRSRLQAGAPALASKALIPLRIQVPMAPVANTPLTLTSPGGWRVGLPAAVPAAWLGELLARLP